MTARLLALAAIAAALAAICAIAIDAPLARAIGAYEPWSGWDAGIHALEYAVGLEPWVWITVIALGAGVVGALAWWPRVAPAWMLVATTHLLARNITPWLKLATGRLRPYEWLARGGDMWLRDGGVAFPSGHITLFASLAIPIAIVVPRLRAPMIAVVAFAMCARVAANAHYASDVLAALALVCACTALWRRIIFGSRSRPPASR